MKKIIFSEGHPDTMVEISKTLGDKYLINFVSEDHILFEELKLTKFDLVLLNVMNGSRLGMHLVPEIKAMGFTVAMFTWSADPHTIDECQKVDLDGFISKADKRNWIADIDDLLRGERVFPDFLRPKKWSRAWMFPNNDVHSRIRSSRSSYQIDLVDKAQN